MIDLEDLLTPKEANEGVEVPLYDSSGKATDARIVIRSVDSDEYRKAYSRVQRSMFLARDTVKEDSAINFDDLMLDHKATLAAALIVDWNGFTSKGKEYPCTPENKAIFCRNSVHNTEAILEFADERGRFVKKKLPDASKSSSDTGDSNSQQEPKAESPPLSKQP